MKNDITSIDRLEAIRNDLDDGIIDMLFLRHFSEDDNPTAGDGIGIWWGLEESTNNTEFNAASLDILSTDITSGAEDVDWKFNTMIAGTLEEFLHVDADGGLIVKLSPLVLSTDDPTTEIRIHNWATNGDPYLSWALGTETVPVRAFALGVDDGDNDNLKLYSGDWQGTGVEIAEVSAGLTGLFAHFQGVEIQTDSAAGRTALLIDNNDTDRIALEFEAANIDADVIQITADTLTSGGVLDATLDTLTTGFGIRLTSTSNVLAAGEMLAINHSATGVTAAKTGDGIDIDFDRTLAAGAVTDNYNALSLTRTSQTSAAVTITAQGSVMQLENADTAGGGGTVTDSVDVLQLIQDALSSGNSLNIDHNANSVAVAVDGNQTTADVIDISATLLTEGTVIDISDLDAFTIGKALHIDATGITQTTGILAHIDSASIALTGVGRLIFIDHTGNASVSGTVAEFKTIAADETILFQLTADALTTGDVSNLTADALTSGHGITATTSSTNLTGVGRLFHIEGTADFDDATGILAEIKSVHTTGTGFLLTMDAATDGYGTQLTADALTSGTGSYLSTSSPNLTTNGRLLKVDATADFDDAGGQVVEIASVHTTGTGLQLTMDAVTDGFGQFITADGLTSGIGFEVESAATGITGTGRVFKVDHTGNASATGIIAEFVTLAADETLLLQLTADAILTGTALDITTDAATQTTTKALNIDSTIADIDANRAGSLVTVNASRTKASVGSGANSDDYDVLAISRTNAQSGGVFTAASGSVLNIANTVSGTVGTDDAYLLEGLNIVPGQNTFKNIMLLAHATSHAAHATAGFGAGIVVHLENDAGTTEEHASIDFVTTSTADGAENTDIVFRIMQAGAVADKLTLDADDGFAFVGAGTFTVNDAVNNAVTDVMILVHSSTVAVAAGIGTGLVFQIEDAGDIEEQGSIDVTLTDVTDGQEDADMHFNINVFGAMTEKLLLNADGFSKLVGGLEIENGGTFGTTALLIDNDDTDQIALEFEAANIDGDVIQVTADALTSAYVMDVTADGLTSGGILNLISDNNEATARTLVQITNDHVGATGATALGIQQDSTGNAITVTSGSDAAASALQITNSAGGFGINVSRNLAAVDTDQALVYINDDGASDQAALHIHTDAVADAGARALLIDADLMTTQQVVELTADALSNGIGMNLTSSSVALTTNGRILKVDAAGDFDDAGGQVVEIASVHTTGTGLQLTMDAVTDGFGQFITVDGLTSGIGSEIESAATGITGTGRIFKVDHTGNATVTGTLVEFATAAADETVLMQLTADALTNGIVAAASFDALTTGTGFSLASTSDVLAAGEMLAIEHIATAITAAKTGDGIDIDFNRTLAAGAQTDNYNAMSLVRTSQTSAAVTITAQGTVLHLENADTAGGGGTVTDSVDVLSIVQDILSVGQSLVIDHNGAANAVEITSASDAATSTLSITNEAGGYGINASRNLAAADTDSPLVYINDDGASDQAALHIHTDAVADAGARALLIDADLMTTQQVMEMTADALTSGIGVNLTTSSVNLTGAGRLLLAEGSGDFDDATGILAEIKSVHTTGIGFQLTMDAVTDGFGAFMTVDALTSGMGFEIESSSTLLTATGRLFLVDHTGNATAAQGAIAEIISAAADNTTITKITASGLLAAGRALDVSVASMTTGVALAVTDADALTSGAIASLISNSADVSTRYLVSIKNDNVLAVGAVPLLLENDAASHDFELINTDPGTEGIVINLHHNSANPAIDDVIASLEYNGEDSASNETEYAKTEVIIADETSGSEEGRVIHYTAQRAGTSTEIYREEIGDLKPIRLNSQSYEWIEDFDDEAAGVQFEAGMVADFWTTAGTNYAAGNVTYQEDAGGTNDAVTAGANDDSVTAIGLANFRINANPILEARFKVLDITNAFICAGFVEGAFADKAAYDDDIAIVGIDTDNAHGFGAGQIIFVSNNNNAGAIVQNCGVAITADTFITIRIDLTDVTQPRVWVNNTGGQITAANEVDPTDITGTVQAGISVAPYFMVQSLSLAADTFTIDYIKCWQDRA